MPPAALRTKRSMVITAIVLLAIGAVALARPTSSGTNTAASATEGDRTPVARTSDPEAIAPDRLAAKVCHVVPRDILVRTVNGTHPKRSGDLQMITPEPDFIASGLTHAPPFDDTQQVPLLIYGPRRVRAGVYEGPATLTDIAPTAASLLEFAGFSAPDGRALDHALLPIEDRDPPKLLVTMVWDSAGVDLLDRWPDSWPFLRRLSGDGAWFTDVQVNSAPANTPPSHATIGTGAYPRHHGMVDEYIWIGGELRKPNSEGPTFMTLPTLGDVYDVAMDNEPVVGGAASLSAHLMMMSHGLGWQGGDDDIAISREVEHAATGGDDTAPRWNLTDNMRPFYRFPEWADDESIDAALEQAKASLDQRDGSLDGSWRGHSIEQMEGGFNTPARSPYQTALFEELVKREHFGDDEVPDLLYLNYKIIDTLGHQFSADGIELSDALEIQDDELKRFVRFLDAEVGHGEWTLILTADHGMQRDPSNNGAFLIDIDRLTAEVESAFGGTPAKPVILKARPTQMWLDVRLLRRNRHTVDDVAAFIRGLTQADVATDAGPRPGEAGARAFQAVFPTDTIGSLPCLPKEVREP